MAFDAKARAATRCVDAASDTPANLNVSLFEGFAAAEVQWRSFERVADCTPFQTFDWLVTWQRRIGQHGGAIPAIAVASFPNGDTAFLLPLCIDSKNAARRLCWLGQDVNDYNAPLLARDFAQRVSPDSFRAIWQELRIRMQCQPRLRHDWIELEKMPQTISGQVNPFFHLSHALNPSGAHFAQLSADWKQFYCAKRSSATRRRDRAKRKHMSQFGEVSFLTSADADDTRRTLETLMAQKGRLLAHRGIADMFARPGWREFFLDIAANPATRHLVHVSRIEVGADCAAANLGVVFGDTYYHVLASYADGALAHYGPGALHLRELLAYAISRGLKQFDFTIGDEPYKLEWSDTHVNLADYTAVTTWRGWLPYCQSAVRRPLKRFIKQTPWTWRMASRFRSCFGPLLRRNPSQADAGGASFQSDPPP